MAEKLIIAAQLCKGCYYCVGGSPKGALRPGDQLNTAGYAYVVQDAEKCVCCGICYTLCPDYALSIFEEEK